MTSRYVLKDGHLGMVDLGISLDSLPPMYEIWLDYGVPNRSIRRDHRAYIDQDAVSSIIISDEEYCKRKQQAIAEKLNQPYTLYLFDLDGTLADRDSLSLYPHAAQWIHDNPNTAWMVCTNQGGVGLRYWMERDGYGKPEEYPTEDTILERFKALIPDRLDKFLVAYAYKSKSSGQWSPTPPDKQEELSWQQDWRKPSPGMLQHAMRLHSVSPQDTLMIGDRDEDEQAADAAGCHFIWAHEFFGIDP